MERPLRRGANTLSLSIPIDAIFPTCFQAGGSVCDSRQAGGLGKLPSNNKGSVKFGHAHGWTSYGRSRCGKAGWNPARGLFHFVNVKGELKWP